MDIKFTPQELLFIYGHFKKEVQNMEKLKSNPNNPIASESLNTDIRLYNSILKKLSDCEPKLLNINPYLEKM